MAASVIHVEPVQKAVRVWFRAAKIGISACLRSYGAIAETWRWHAGSGGGCGLAIVVGDNLQPVCKLHSLNDLWQLLWAIEAAPGLLRALEKFEDHRKCRLV